MITTSFRDKLEDYQTNIERGLSIAAWVPVVLPGAVKVLYGVIQTIAAFAVGIFAGLRALAEGKDRDGLFKYAFEVQFFRGIDNIVIGILEAIPLIGWCLNELQMGRYRYPSKKNNILYDD